MLAPQGLQVENDARAMAGRGFRPELLDPAIPEFLVSSG
jgi:hypothetical protein